jgi:hypothetical protein
MDYRTRRDRQIDQFAPEIPRTKYGSPIWPRDPFQAWIQLCDLARVAPDTPLNPDQLLERLRANGELIQLTTVARIYQDWKGR